MTAASKQASESDYVIAGISNHPMSSSPINSQAPGPPSFRLQRASRACETCHARKVRCDAASLGRPCTNCVAFSIECKIPSAKKKKTVTSKIKINKSDRGDAPESSTPKPSTPLTRRDNSVSIPQDVRIPKNVTGIDCNQKDEEDKSSYVKRMKSKFSRAPIKEAGRVAYLGESSNLNLLVNDKNGTTDVVHYPLPENVGGSCARLADLDKLEIDILHQRGAFLLPPKVLCDELIDSYFKWVAPIVPVINRNRFMRQYDDPKNPPSLLLLQAVLLAGSRVCTNPQLMDANGSATPAALTFYKRAKALFEANYEDNRVTIVQALTLMGWYWDGPEDVTKNVFYWSRVATIVAQGSGMHRSVEGSQLSPADKRLWKRIWWTLYTRDRSVAVALGRPVHINTDDSDVEMICENDFIEDENPKYPPDKLHVQFFLQYVKLCEVMGLVLSQQYSVASKARRQNSIDLTHSDVALADWLQNCPKEIYWDTDRHHFWSALLHSNYYTTLCLLHRAHMPAASNTRLDNEGESNTYPSKNIAFQAAAMITCIIRNLGAHNELRFCPAFMVYSLFSALILHVYQMSSPTPSIVLATQDRIRICMNALKDVSRVWLVAKVVYSLFESVLSNKTLEERLQRAAGTRHKKIAENISYSLNQAHQAAQAGEIKREPVGKRKYDDMALEFAVNSPAPQESYERSRPQTPSQMSGREVGYGTAPSAARLATSPNNRQNSDTFLVGPGSRLQTRPPSPLNSFSLPNTPRDLYLVTRNSPNLSQSRWENFQPDQLFPEGSTSICAAQISPPLSQHNLDPNLDLNLNITMVQNSSPQFSHRARSSGSRSIHESINQSNFVGPETQTTWQVSFQGQTQGETNQSPNESIINNSIQGSAVPMTMNVEDWFQFFGINGDLNGISVEIPMA
ncbi:Cutinase transcription factor 1 alpha [Podosphaera aphanis]|nr:Cutinase transcription factor 1 alpha [Podosphaera aphanis]